VILNQTWENNMVLVIHMCVQVRRNTWQFDAISNGSQ